MQVLARFYVAEIIQRSYDRGARTVKLQAVSRGTENKEWAAATPSGNIEMVINNAAAASQFELGREYLITFELAPNPADKPLLSAYQQI